MASSSSSTLFAFSSILISIFFFFTTTTLGKFSEQFANTNPTIQAEKTTHLHFYFHDIVSGKNPTAVTVAGKNNSFGATAIVDDPLTEGTEHGSKIVGRAQGLYSLASLDGTSLLMVMNFLFLEGKFNGSAISLLGRNRVFDSVREMPIVGGSGVFRFCRGYALAKTVRVNLKKRDAVVEYDVFIRHG